MIREAIGSGATINDAKENAIAKLGAGLDDDIQFEVISTPKKKILGIFGGNSAEVKAFIEVPDIEKKPAKKAVSKKPAKAANKPVKNQVSAPAAKAETQKPQKAGKKIETADVYKNTVDASQIAADSYAGKAVAYLKSILCHLGCENVTVKIAEKENGAAILLDGEGLGVIIGHRGETLDSIQYLTNLAANNGGGYFKVTIDTGNYREKREKTLISLAKRVSQQVLRTGRSRSLEPMNPYERRVIHTAVQEIDGVVSNSFGEGSNRRVVIFPEGAEQKPPRRDSGRQRRPKSNTSIKTESAPSREPKKDSDIPLYGKIN